MAKTDLYKCPNKACGHICTEDDMEADYTEDNWWNAECPKCGHQAQTAKEWIKIEEDDDD